MRQAVLIGLCALLFSCRDIQPFQTTSSIQGYQLDGTVTSPNGIPLDSVVVRLFYNYDVVSDTPIDTQKVIVTDPNKIVDVAVYTPDYAFVRQLFLNYLPRGSVPHFLWDGRDLHGAIAPSGEYLVRYAIDSVIFKYSIVVVGGNVSATTDPLGHFVLTGDRLPGLPSPSATSPGATGRADARPAARRPRAPTSRQPARQLAPAAVLEAPGAGPRRAA